MFDVGDYGFYVWASYGISALVIGGLIADTLWRARSWRRRAEQRKAGKSR